MRQRPTAARRFIGALALAGVLALGACDGDGGGDADLDGRRLDGSVADAHGGLDSIHGDGSSAALGKHTNIVATLFSRTTASGSKACHTAADAEGAAAGLWDLGGYSSCASDGTPRCGKGAVVMALALADLPEGGIESHVACVLSQQPRATNIVATIAHQLSAEGGRACSTTSCWDRGGYSACDAHKNPVCLQGAKRVVMAMSARPGGGIEYQSACVLSGETLSTNIVATIYGSTSSGGDKLCRTAADPALYALGYWDLGAYASCDAANEPQCERGSQRVLLDTTNLADGTLKHHYACVLGQEKGASPVVATLYSRDLPGGNVECGTASDPAVAAQGYWDLAHYASCDARGEPRCQHWSKRIGLASSHLPDGSVRYEFACVLPELLYEGSISADELHDGATVTAFAHQDDDLLWMEPFLMYSRKVVLSALPTTSLFKEEVIAHYPEDYQQRWEHPFGEKSQNELETTWWVPCKRQALITLDIIKEHLRPYVADPQTKRVMTHNNWGEYGHAHHRWVNRAVRELAQQYGKDVWMLGMRLDQSCSDSGCVGDIELPGLQSITGVWDHALLNQLRAAYLAARRVLDPSGNLWTWNAGELYYPYGRHKFYKIVDHGRDLTATVPEIQDLVDSVPITGLCQD